MFISPTILLINHLYEYVYLKLVILQLLLILFEYPMEINFRDEVYNNLNLFCGYPDHVQFVGYYLIV